MESQETYDYEHVVKFYAKQQGMTLHDALKFLANRRTTEAALELLGYGLINTLVNTDSMEKASPIVNGFKAYLISQGFAPPEIDFEPSVSFYVDMDKDADISEDVPRYEYSTGLIKRQSGKYGIW